MNTLVPVALLIILPSLALAGPSDSGQSRPPANPPKETLQRPDGRRVVGQLIGDGASGFQFRGEGDPAPTRLVPGMVVSFEGSGPGPADGFPPFRVDLGLGQRISGRLGRVDGGSVRLDASSLGGAVSFARPGVHAVVQRFGEMQILDDGFESLNASRWTLTGDPEIDDGRHVAGSHSLRIPAGGSSVTTRLAKPVGAGRLEVAFHDDGAVAAGQQWFVDLLFRARAGSETVRVVLGWAEESLSIESPGGPALAVQRLARKPGWHRLSVRFGPRQTEVGVDGNDLGHGKGPEGALVEVRLASVRSGKDAPLPGLAGHLDDLRLVRFADPVSGLEVDPSQDEVRLADGDQVFGAIREADGERVALKMDDQLVTLPWSEVAGLAFRRDAVQGAMLEGLLVQVSWRSAPGDDPRDLDQVEGSLVGVTDASLTLGTPFAGRIAIPRDRLHQLRVVGQGRRLLIDGTAHHLGNEIVGGPLPLDPPQPEGGTLERRFRLDELPAGPASLALDVVQVVGEANGLPFSDLVKKGEVRTNVKINGKPVDYLNRHISSKNETPERIRLPIAPGVLQAGENVVRLEQVGKAGDPEYLDDLGVLGIALEFTEPGPARRADDKP